MRKVLEWQRGMGGGGGGGGGGARSEGGGGGNHGSWFPQVLGATVSPGCWG